MMSQMCNAFVTHFGPAPFAEMASELQHSHHTELELMYYDAACSLGLYGFLIPSFLSFGNPLRYAGSSPSVHYLKAIFVDWLIAHQIFIKQAHTSLPANVMKVDHMSFSICCLKISKMFIVSQIYGWAQWQAYTWGIRYKCESFWRDSVTLFGAFKISCICCWSVEGLQLNPRYLISTCKGNTLTLWAPSHTERLPSLNACSHRTPALTKHSSDRMPMHPSCHHAILYIIGPIALLPDTLYIFIYCIY